MEDLRLPYIDNFTENGLAIPPAIPYFFRPRRNYGYLPCRHQWLPPTGTFGSPMNSLTYGLRVRIEDAKQAIIRILGRPITSPGSGFSRILPIGDPDGFGMVATEVSVRGYEGKSGLIKMEIYDFGTQTLNGLSPDGRRWNNELASGFNPTGLIDHEIGKLLPVYRYVLLNVKFEHVQYYVCSDDEIDSNPRGERDRFTIWNYIPGIEYVSLDSNTLEWREGPKLGQTVGKGAGFIRATGELKCQWFGVPAASLKNLLQKWLGFGNLANITRGPINGRVNNNNFTVDITNLNELVTFPAETLLMQPPKTAIRPSVTGFRIYDVEMSLTHRPELWNKFLYWPTGEYFRVKYQPDNPAQIPPRPQKPVYELVDFEEAFTN